jgi:TatD DNase family protein
MYYSYLIDTHSHINFNAYKNDAKEVIRRALDENIRMIAVGAQYSTSRRALDYAKSYDGIYAAVGLHPTHIKGTFEEGLWSESERELEEFDKKKYKKLLQNDKVVAVGEVGLDYYDKSITDQAKTKQREVLEAQLGLAKETNKSVIIHCRKAYDDLIEILENHTNIRAVVHSFEGRKSQAQKLVGMGFYLGFNGMITYVSGLEKIVASVPLDKILIETDSPFLTPEPYRGQRNEPMYVKYIAEKIAEIKQAKIDQVAYQTTQNAKKLFGL